MDSRIHVAILFGVLLFTWLSNKLDMVFTALEALVEKRITGFPVIDDDWKLVFPSHSFLTFDLGFS